MESNEVKRAIKLALTENPDKRITPKELEDAMIKTVDYVDETKTSLEKYVDEKLANVPDVPETPETPDAPGCECEPVEKKEPYVLNIEALIVKGGGINENAEVAQKVREALLSGAGVYVHYVLEHKDIIFDSIDYTRTWAAPFEHTDLYASKHITIDYANSTCYLKLGVRVGGDFISITPSIERIYIDKDTVRTAELISLYSMIKPDLKGVFRMNGNDYNIEFAKYEIAYSKVTLYLYISRFDLNSSVEKYRVAISESAIAVTNIPVKENPIKTEELYYNDGSDKLVPIRHPDLSTQPSILPYKFAGNYVYEQMFYISEHVDTDAHFVTIPFTADELSEGELPVIIDCNISAELSWNSGTVKYTKHVTKCDATIFFDESRGHALNLEFLREAEDWADGGLVFVNGWVRLVWTKKPDMSGGDDYYYQQQQGDGTLRVHNLIGEDIKVNLCATDTGYAPFHYNVRKDEIIIIPKDETSRFASGEFFMYVSKTYGDSIGNNFTMEFDTDEQFSDTVVTASNGNTYCPAIDLAMLQSYGPKALAKMQRGDTVDLTFRRL